MITEYQELAMVDQPWQYVRIWKQLPWLERTQLETLFHMNHSQMGYALQRVKKHFVYLHLHNEAFSIITIRKSAHCDEYCEWVKQIQHYDPWVVEKLHAFYPTSEAAQFLTWAAKTEVRS